MQTKSFDRLPGAIHRHPAALVASIVLALALVAGCGGDDESGAADAAANAADSAVSDPDGQQQDGVDGSVGDDAMTGEDGGSSADVEATCMTLCEHIDSCSGDGDVPGCVSDCKVDLADCAEGELSAITNCTDVPCPGLEPCMASVPCTAQQ